MGRRLHRSWTSDPNPTMAQAFGEPVQVFKRQRADVAPDEPYCRIHNVPAVMAIIDGVKALSCGLCAIEGMDPHAGVSTPSDMHAKPRKGVAVTSEDDVQRDIVQALRTAGYLVLITSRRRKRCVKCGQYSAGGDGADRGVPDLLVRWHGWTPAMWIGIEVKGPRTQVSDEQAELVRYGAIRIARSVQDALAICEEARKLMPYYDPFVPDGDDDG